MCSRYSETLWEQIISGPQPWNEKGPFLGKKKGFRSLRVAAGAFENLVKFEPSMTCC